MAELDFTALNKLAYRGFETVEEKAKRDEFIDRGFSFVETDEGNPFLQASQTASEPLIASALSEQYATPQSALQSKLEAFTNVSGTRNYKAMYRAAHDFHKRHNPPTVDREYWREHTAGEDEAPQMELDYWIEAAKDMDNTAKTYNNDPFLMDLLAAVYREIEREYHALCREKGR